MGYIQDFHRKHDEATSQNAKDWLLAKAVMREVLRCGGKALLIFFVYLPAVICGRSILFARDLFADIIYYPKEVWHEGLRDTFIAIAALRYLRNPTLPVNRKPLPEKG